MDDVLKVELGLDLYIRVPRFHKAFFREIAGLETTATAVFIKCQKGIDPLYSKELGWCGWLQGAKEKDVLK